MLTTKIKSPSLNAQIVSASNTTHSIKKHKNVPTGSISAEVKRRKPLTATSTDELRTLQVAARVHPSSEGEVHADSNYYWQVACEAGAESVRIPLTLTPSFNPFDEWVGEVRHRYATFMLPPHMIFSLESIPGWTWRPTTEEAVFYLWRARTERALEKAFEHWLSNELVELRIKQFDALRRDWMANPAFDAVTRANLNRIGDDWITLKFDVDGTLRLAAAKLLAQSVGADSYQVLEEDEEIAQMSFYSWLLGYLLEFYRIEIPLDEYSYISSDGNRVGVDDGDLLKTEVAARLRRIASI